MVIYFNHRNFIFSEFKYALEELTHEAHQLSKIFIIIILFHYCVVSSNYQYCIFISIYLKRSNLKGQMDDMEDIHSSRVIIIINNILHVPVLSMGLSRNLRT